MMMRDQDFGIVRLRAFGIYDFQIVDPKLFLKEVAGTDDHFRLDEFTDTMRSRIVSVFTDALAQSKIPVLDVAARYGELGERAAAADQSADDRQVRPRDDQLRRRERVGAAGSRAGDRQALEHGGGRQPQRLRQVPDGAGPGEGQWRRRAAWRAEMAVGMAMAQQMMNQPGGIMGCAGDAGGSARRRQRSRQPRRSQLMTPAQVAQLLGVAESDVVASLENGDLKGKQIGTQWRVTRAAVDQFLHS